ncbi:MAG: AAA family ATPase [Corynebacteriales bacterium]|nr:AAA family ATPase [Mycobacteriales bacterium]
MQTLEGAQSVGNVPTEVTAFVARRKELSEVKRRLGASRLVTLTGVGGVGKTRLALRVADQMRRVVKDGVWLVDLTPLSEPELLAVHVTNALDIRDQSSRPTIESIIEHLQGKQVLLVLDNCEHLLDSCAKLVSTLLKAAPGLRILATSRQLLGVEGEYVFAVPPLEVPARELPTSKLAQYGAVALLVDRASARVPEFKVNENNRGALVRLCQRLDGIPLAIELAAVRLNTMSIEEILDRLDDRFRLLTGGWRTSIPHQQTLRATFDWSHSLCVPDEKLLWARLSVFSGGFDLSAAEDVCSDEQFSPEQVLNALTGLVDKSIVNRDNLAPRTRFRMLETTRQYGQQLLAEHGDEMALRRRHRDHYLAMATEMGADWFSPRELEWMAITRQELSNLRIALEYCLAEPGEAAAGLDIAVNLTRARVWFFIGTLTEGRLWLGRTLAKNAEPSANRLTAQSLVAWIHLVQGDQHATMKELDECRKLAQHVPDAEANAILGFVEAAYALLGQGDPHAIELLLQARYQLEKVEAYGDAHMATMLWGMANAFLADGPAALSATAEFLAKSESQQAAWATSWALFNAGLAEFVHGSARRAEELLVESLRRQHEMRDSWGPPWGLEVLAWTVGTADPRRTAELLGAAQSLRHQNGVSINGIRPFIIAHEDCENDVRRTLGTKAYERALERGAALTFDEAIALAVDQGTTSARSESKAQSILTEREREVAELVAAGLKNQQIAARLTISPRTAETHVQHILAKLGFASRAHIATWVSEQRSPGKPE